jgi:hypothetical protein
VLSVSPMKYVPDVAAFHWTVKVPLPEPAVNVAPATVEQPEVLTVLPDPWPKSVLKLPVVIAWEMTTVFDPAAAFTRTQ